MSVYIVLRTDTNHAISIRIARTIEKADDIMREDYLGVINYTINNSEGGWNGCLFKNGYANLAGPHGERFGWVILKKEIE